MRDALSLLDQVLSFTEGAPTADDVRRVLGLVGSETYLEIFDIIAERRHAEVFRYVGRLMDEGYDLAEFYRGLADALRSLLVTRLDGVEAAGVREDLRDAFALEAGRFAVGDLLRMLAQTAELDTDGRFRKSGQQRLLLELLLLRFSYLESTVSLEAVLAALGGGSTELPLGAGARIEEASARPVVRETPAPRIAPPSPPVAPTPPPSAAQPPVQERTGSLGPGEVKRAWRATVEAGEGVPPGTTLFLRSAPLAFADGVLRVQLPAASPALDRLATPAARRPLERALARQLGHPVTLEFVAEGGPESPEPPRITAESHRQDRLRRLTEDEPLLAAAVREWDLELVD
jgi:DNA polymerase-3 subunit gamma/tau